MPDLFETQRDLSNEWFDVMAFLMHMSSQSKLQFNGKKIDVDTGGFRNTADYYIIPEGSEQAVGVVEYKCRNLTLRKATSLGGLFLSMGKYNTLIKDYPERYGLKSVFLVRFNDGLRYIPLSKPHTVMHGIEKGIMCRDGVKRSDSVVYFSNERDWIEVPDQYGE
ncbi:MAG: hypothetical protein J7K90_09735 [Desulfuromusa sp.]|nr:hypothetical protein [Desulfuromusa sp.]